MGDATVPEVRSRLSGRGARHLLPFYRAQNVTDASLYWLPVSEFPIRFRQREWILKLLNRLTADLARDGQVVENFLQVKYTRTVLNDRFVNTMSQYRPMIGLMLAPSQQLPEVPTSMEIKKLTESHGPDGTINIDHLAPDYCAWFAGPQSEEQRQDFFGVGGMALLWMDQAADAGMPAFELPNVLKTHPAMKGVDFAAQMQRGARLQQPFLKRSREVFAAHLPEGPAKRHSLFVVPRLRSREILDATPEIRQSWFELFSGYCMESEEDKGVLLLLKDAQFDDRMMDLLQHLAEDEGEYPL